MKNYQKKITSEKYSPLQGNYDSQLIDTVKKMLILDADSRITIENICNLSFIQKIYKYEDFKKELSDKEPNLLGHKFENGESVEKNLVETMKYLKKSVDLGNASRMNNYGWSLEKGWSGHTDILEAMKYFKMSDDLDNVSGMNNYGQVIPMFLKR
jgi:TPR repeat protein